MPFGFGQQISVLAGNEFDLSCYMSCQKSCSLFTLSDTGPEYHPDQSSDQDFISNILMGWWWGLRPLLGRIAHSIEVSMSERNAEEDIMAPP